MLSRSAQVITPSACILDVPVQNLTDASDALASGTIVLSQCNWRNSITNGQMCDE
jgi:hypothetical protein